MDSFETLKKAYEIYAKKQRERNEERKETDPGVDFVLSNGTLIERL